MELHGHLLYAYRTTSSRLLPISSCGPRSELWRRQAVSARADPSPFCSGVRFLVHKANLAVSSTVFADMFATASSDSGGERPSIELQESAEILERLLPYCYPSVVPIWQHDAVKDLQFIRAIDKYMVSLAAHVQPARR